MKNRLETERAAPSTMAARLHLLQTCPFCWKVRTMIDHLGLDVEMVQINPLRTKKDLAFAGDWGKVPVWTEEDGSVVVDSTPIMLHLDRTRNEGRLHDPSDQRQQEWLEWVDSHLSKATVPLLYGSLGAALKTTVRVSRMERFGFFSRRLYAWAGFPVMWGFIARRRVKRDGRTPKALWHDLLTEFTGAFDGAPYFGGETPNLVDLAAYGYMRSTADYPQFQQLRDHTEGMAWFTSMGKRLERA
jgi:microsomal prostaglandin-E synthase 2